MSPQPRLVELRHNVFKKNDLLARELRTRFQEAGVQVIGLVSSPGSGKTAFLEKMLTTMRPHSRVAALVGDLTIGNGTDGYGTARAILKGSDPCKPLSVWRELWVTPTSGTKNGDGTPKQRYVSLILAGIVMPVRVA